MSAAFTPGPWRLDYMGGYGKSGVYADDAFFMDNPLGGVFLPPDYADGGYSQRAFDVSEANALLIAAAPELYDGCNALLGLIQLLQGRDDLSDELREVLATNHRIAEAEAATAKARGEAS